MERVILRLQFFPSMLSFTPHSSAVLEKDSVSLPKPFFREPILLTAPGKVTPRLTAITLDVVDDCIETHSDKSDVTVHYGNLFPTIHCELD